MFDNDYNANNQLDVAVDKKGAIYVAKAQFTYDSNETKGSYENIIAKYSSGGSLQ